MTGFQFIRQARFKAGMSQRQLALLIKRIDGDGSVSAQFVNCIEHGRRTYKPYIHDLAVALNVSELALYYFLGELPPLYGCYDQEFDLGRVCQAFEAFKNVMLSEYVQ